LNHLLQIAGSTNGWIIQPAVWGDTADGWTQMQTATGLFVCPEIDRAEAALSATVIDRPFENSKFCDPFIPGYGWPHFRDGEPSAEAIGWGLVAVAGALRRAELLPSGERERLRQHLDQLQSALDRYRSHDEQSNAPNGGWNLFPGQDDPG